MDKKAFLREVEEDDRPFVKRVAKTQLFRHFIEDAFEYDDNYEINLFNDCVEVVKGLKEYAEEYIFDQLLPSHWPLERVEVPLPTGEGVPEEWEREGRVSRRWFEEELMRDVECFPRLKEENYGSHLSRMKVEVEEKQSSIVPRDMKSVLKKYRQWCVCYRTGSPRSPSGQHSLLRHLLQRL